VEILIPVPVAGRFHRFEKHPLPELQPFIIIVIQLLRIRHHLVDPADDFIEKDRCANLPPPTVDWIQLSADEATDGGTQQISRC